jgi:hypothetical protein
MKKIFFLPVSVLSVALFSLIVAVAQSSNRKSVNSTSVPALNGGWQRVYHHNGKTATTGEPKEFVVVYDGFFSSIGQDAEGRWINTHGGSFELNGNLMKNHLLYSSHPDILGFTNWVEYELKADTLIMKWNIKKMITAQGQEITIDRPSSESKYIRAKK